MAVSPTVRIDVSGARGKSEADILRLTGAYGVLPTDSDLEAELKKNAVAIAAKEEAELARDQAADLVLPQNIFSTGTLAAAEASVAIGINFKWVHDGVADIRKRTSGGSDLLYQEATTAALAASDGAKFLGHRSRDVGAALDDRLNILDYGVVVNNAADNASSLNAVAELARITGKGLYCPYRTSSIYIASAVNLVGIRDIEINPAIRVHPAIVGVPVDLGGFANGGTVCWWFGDVTDGTSVVSAAPPSRPILRIRGSKSSSMHFGSCNYLQVLGNSAAGATYGSNAYNHINLDGVCSLFEITDDGNGNDSWCNGNTIWRGRIIRWRILGINYFHNHNKGVDNTFEGDKVEITYAKAYANRISGARFENVAGAPGFSSDTASYSNTIEMDWSGTGNPRAEFVVPIPKNDAGMGNSVHTFAQANYHKIPLFDVNAASGIVSNASATSARSPRVAAFNAGITSAFTGSGPIKPGLAGFEPPANRWIGLTEPIPVERGDVIQFDGDFDGSNMRLVVFVLDANQRPLTAEGGNPFISQLSTVFNSPFGYYVSQASLSMSQVRNAAAAIMRSEVKFVRIGMYISTAALVRSVSACLWVQPSERLKAEGYRDREDRRGFAGVPTQGYVPQGTIIENTGGTTKYVCAYQYESLTTAALAAGDTSVTAVSAAGVANGDVVGILLDDGTTHWTTVSALSGATFTVAALPAGKSAGSGARVAWNRWSTL